MSIKRCLEKISALSHSCKYKTSSNDGDEELQSKEVCMAVTAIGEIRKIVWGFFVCLFWLGFNHCGA